MRVYSLHKECSYNDILCNGAIDTFCFDRVGQFLLVSGDNEIRAFYHRDFTMAIGRLPGRADMLCFDEHAKYIIARDQRKVTYFSQ